MVAGFIGHLVSRHDFIIIIDRLSMGSDMGGLSRSHWSNTLGTSGLLILIIKVKAGRLELQILGIKHLLFVLVGRRSPEEISLIL